MIEGRTVIKPLLPEGKNRGNRVERSAVVAFSPQRRASSSQRSDCRADSG
jgi:hypothetical protein